MKKITTLIIFLTTTLFINAQKANVVSKKVKLQLKLPEFISNIKTVSYSIQDDGEYWNYTPTPKQYPVDKYPTLTSLTDGITINGLENVSENGDLQIIVGFTGNQLSVKNALISMKGTFNIMLFIKGNQLIHNYNTNVTLNEVAGTKYPMNNRHERNQTKARMLTVYTQKYLDKNFIFSKESIQKLPFGLFKKTKKGAAASFNKQTAVLIESIINNPKDISFLNDAINYWNSQLEVDFGKKVKDKHKNKVIYANLTTASILKNDLTSAKQYYKKAKENAGFFDTWTVAYDQFFKKLELLETLKNKNFPTLKILPNLSYFITINDGGTYTYKKKEIIFSKIEIDRFIPNKSSGIASLDTNKKPRIFIYDNDEKSLRHFGSEHNKIITNSGKEIIFKIKKGVYKPYIKQQNGSYTEFYGN